MRRRSVIFYRQDGTPPAPVPSGVGPVVPLDQQQAAARQQQIEQENARLKQENEQLKGQFKEGSKKLEELHATIVSPEYLQFIATKKRGGGTGTGEGTAPQGPTEEDINNMDNAELTKFILTGVKHTVREALGPVQERTESLTAHEQVRAAAGQFPDFWEYREAMIPIAEKNPRLDPITVYLTVKGLEAATGKSYKTPKPPKGDGEGDEGSATSRRSERSPVSSELGSGPDNSLGTERGKEPKSYGEAASKAYDKIFGRG